MTEHARAIWDAAVDAVRPRPIVAAAMSRLNLPTTGRVIVVGGGKAGADMAAGVEDALVDRLESVEGVVNVPDELARPLRRIELHAARPSGRNEPTAAGVAGVERMVRLVGAASADDTVICLISGGGSALLPAPVPGVSLDDKLAVTRLLAGCGATIQELNCVRKHISRVKGGGLAAANRAGRMVSLLMSDVIGDPLDVIASGPTAADPTTFADALAVLDKYQLQEMIPPGVLNYLRRGQDGNEPETVKVLPANVENHVIASNRIALTAAEVKARSLGYAVVNLGSYIAGDTEATARTMADIARSVARDGVPVAPPACVLSGGETTVALPVGHGVGGRNQQFVLAAMLAAGDECDWTILSGGTDGEDGPTAAAGAVATRETLAAARRLGIDGTDYLRRCDAFAFFERVGGLIRCGMTGTNVMDVRVWLVRLGDG